MYRNEAPCKDPHVFQNRKCRPILVYRCSIPDTKNHNSETSNRKKKKHPIG